MVCLVLLVALGIAGLARYPLDTPGEADGTAWTDTFLTTATRKLLEARGPAIPALFPVLTGPGEANDGCAAFWRHTGLFAPIVLRQALQIEKVTGQPCDASQLLFLSSTIRVSAGVTPDGFTDWLSKRYGPPKIKPSYRWGQTSFTWEPVHGLEMELTTSSTLEWRESFVFNVDYHGGDRPLHPPPSEAQQGALLDTVVATLVDPKLMEGHRPDVGHLFGGMVDEDKAKEDGCFDLQLKLWESAYVRSASARFDPATTARNCDTARLHGLSLSLARSHAWTLPGLLSKISHGMRQDPTVTMLDDDFIVYGWTLAGGHRLQVQDVMVADMLYLSVN